MTQFLIWLFIVLLFTGASIVSGYKAKEAWDKWHAGKTIAVQIKNSAGDSNPSPVNEASKIDVAKLKIKRAFEDCEQAVENIKKNFPEESDKLAVQFNRRGVLSSSGHIQAQMNLSITTKAKLVNLLTELERNIEDVLIEDFNKTTLTKINGHFNEEVERLDKIKNKLYEIYKLLTDTPKSWEMKALRELRLTKDFNL